MIVVTRLNDKRFVLNAALIKSIEETPDTLITLTTGDKIMVKEAMNEVVQKAIEFGRQVRSFQV